MTTVKVELDLDLAGSDLTPDTVGKYLLDLILSDLGSSIVSNTGQEVPSEHRTNNR